MAEPITVQGVKISALSLTRDNDGKLKVTGKYELMGSNGNILAKQSFGNGYDEIPLAQSPGTIKLIQEAVTSITTDINTSMGLV